MGFPVFARPLSVRPDQERGDVKPFRRAFDARDRDQALVLGRDAADLREQRRRLVGQRMSLGRIGDGRGAKGVFRQRQHLHAELGGVIDHVDDVGWSAVAGHVHLDCSDLGHRPRRNERLLGNPEHRRLFIRQRHDAVGLRAAVGDLVVRGVYRFVRSLVEIDGRDGHSMGVVGHLGDHPALRIDDHAAARIVDRALVAGLGGRDEPDAVLVSARRPPHVSLVHGEEIRHVDDDVRALHRHGAEDLGDAAVEADQQPDAAEIGLDDRAAPLAEGEPVLVVGRQELLVVVAGDLAFPAEHDAAVEDLLPLRIPLGHAAGDVNPVLLRELGQRADEGTIGDRFGESPAMFGRVRTDIRCPCIRGRRRARHPAAPHLRRSSSRERCCGRSRPGARAFAPRRRESVASSCQSPSRPCRFESFSLA